MYVCVNVCMYMCVYTCMHIYSYPSISKSSGEAIFYALKSVVLNLVGSRERDVAFAYGAMGRDRSFMGWNH